MTVRAGGHGQLGLGGHSHNNQLSLAVWLDGVPLIVDPGTFCYAADPVWRDHLRATAAHATLLVDGEEQSPLHEGRPFALPNRARGRLLFVDGSRRPRPAVAHHTGYQRLRCHALHQREVLLDHVTESLLVTNLVDGRGEATVEARFPLGGEDVRRGVIGSLAVWERLGLRDEGEREAAVVWRGGRPWAALVPSARRHRHACSARSGRPATASAVPRRWCASFGGPPTAGPRGRQSSAWRERRHHQPHPAPPIRRRARPAHRRALVQPQRRAPAP